MPSVAADCVACGRHFSTALGAEDTILSCPGCGKEWPFGEAQRDFKVCTFCGCTKFYVQKDFHHVLGCLAILAGIVLVPWTYGLSLPALWLVDLALRRRTPLMVVCYRCRNQFRGFEIPPQLREFHHFTAAQYEPKS